LALTTAIQALAKLGLKMPRYGIRSCRGDLPKLSNNSANRNGGALAKRLGIRKGRLAVEADSRAEPEGPLVDPLAAPHPRIGLARP
jgi:hypothetical protein